LTALFRLFPSTFATAISFSSDRAVLVTLPAFAGDYGASDQGRRPFDTG
jgi:hypothetical protein